MTGNDRMTCGLFLEVPDVLERHDYHRSDTLHTAQAIRLVRDVAEGTKDAPRGSCVAVPPIAAQSPGRVGQDAVILTGADISTVIAALDIAADDQRGLAAACADCANHSCLTCQSRLRDAHAYDRLVGQFLHASEAAQQPGPDRAQPALGQPQAAADPEAGQ